MFSVEKVHKRAENRRLTLDVDELFGLTEVSFVQSVVVGDAALGLGHRDDHAVLLLPEHLLGTDGSLEMVLLWENGFPR